MVCTEGDDHTNGAERPSSGGWFRDLIGFDETVICPRRADRSFGGDFRQFECVLVVNDAETSRILDVAGFDLCRGQYG